MEDAAVDMNKIAPLFEGWNETMVWSCLQGYMGEAFVDNESSPTAALIETACFGFFAGRPDEYLVRKTTSFLLAAKTEDWEPIIESVWGDKFKKILRYAIKKEPDVFDREKLSGFAAALPAGFTMRLIDKEIYEQAAREEWSVDLCYQFPTWEDYAARGIGVGVLCDGALVAGASSYTIYRGGIEIEIDTKPEYRQQGLATACGARLILECLDRGLYPSWDAHDLRSVALAEKLGYHMDHPYTAYMLADYTAHKPEEPV